MDKLMMKSIVIMMVIAVVGCGQPQPYDDTSSLNIFGGRSVQTSDAEYQHTVAVYPRGSLCSGTLIAPDLVVSAAHCFRGSQGIQVGFGHRGTERINVVQLWMHPRYNLRRNPPNDIALLRLARNAPEGARPVQIMSPELDPSRAKWVVAGYGVTERGSLGQLLATDIGWHRIASRGYEISLQGQRGKNTCQGDSGGPAYAVVNGVYFLAGATSRGSSNCANGDGLYTFVPKYIDWIKQVSGRDISAGGSDVPPANRLFIYLANYANDRFRVYIAAAEGTTQMHVCAGRLDRCDSSQAGALQLTNAKTRSGRTIFGLSAPLASQEQNTYTIQGQTRSGELVIRQIKFRR